MDQTFLHLHFQDAAMNTTWHSTNYNTIWHSVQITSSFFFGCVTSAPGYLKICINLFFFKGEEKLSLYLNVCGWGQWIKLTKDRLPEENAHIFVNDWTKNQKEKTHNQMVKFIKANLIDILNFTSTLLHRKEVKSQKKQ